MNASFVPLVYFFYPETRGLSLEKIDQIFEGDRGHGLSGFTQGVRESVKISSESHKGMQHPEGLTANSGSSGEVYDKSSGSGDAAHLEQGVVRNEKSMGPVDNVRMG